MTYDPKAPYEYILAAYANILGIGIPLVTEVGHLIPIPVFEQVILEDLCKCATNYFQRVPIVLQIDGPLVVVGDLHGNIFDLIRILTINRPPPYQKYLFLGDYVDRGEFSVEVITIMFALALKYPKNIYLLRGNHEETSLNSLYGFKQELSHNQYSNDLWVKFNIVFDLLPFAAILNGRIFCVHGGLSPDLKSLDDLHRIHKPISPQSSSLLLDIIWSDPTDASEDFTPSLRGSGKQFGKNVIYTFLADFGFDAIFRGHQCVVDGVERFGETDLYTIFSCSNYCDRYQNRCGFIIVYEGNSFQAYALPPIPQVKRANTSMISVPTIFIPTFLLQKVDPTNNNTNFTNDEVSNIPSPPHPVSTMPIEINFKPTEKTNPIASLPSLGSPAKKNIKSYANPFRSFTSNMKIGKRKKSGFKPCTSFVRPS